MAVNIKSKNENNSYSKKSNYFNLNKRQVNLALNHLIIHRHDVHLPNDLEYLNIYCNNLKLDEEYKDWLIQVSKANVIPDESVSWLQDDLRAALWFNQYLYYFNHDIRFSWGNYFSDFQSNLITSFDLTYINLGHYTEELSYQVEYKRNFMNHAKSLYSTIRTKPRDLEWLDENDEKQVLWACDYLSNQGLLIVSPLFVANSLSCYYAHICASLDTLDNEKDTFEKIYKTSLYKKDILNKIRGAWSQKKFRDKMDSNTAQEVLLGKRYVKKLSHLANFNKIDNVDYLKFLIDESYDSSN